MPLLAGLRRDAQVLRLQSYQPEKVRALVLYSAAMMAGDLLRARRVP
jgi:hypothetical protein